MAFVFIIGLRGISGLIVLYKIEKFLNNHHHHTGRGALNLSNRKFIPLQNLLLEDNKEVRKIKSLYLREEEYSYLLGPIEHTIASYYLTHRNLRDKDIKRMIGHIKLHYDEDIASFKDPLEKEIIEQLSFVLQEVETTKHEFFLALNYILCSIDNRTWTNDNKAYLEWLLTFFGMMDKKEKKKFDSKYDELGEKFGINKKKIAIIKSGVSDDFEIDLVDEQWSKKNSQYFSMSDEEKADFYLQCRNKAESSMILPELMESAEAYLQNKKYEKSIRILDTLLKGNLDQGIREVISSLAIECFICMKDYEEAEKRIKALITLNEKYPMAYFHRAVIQFNQNDLQKALEHLDICINVAEEVNMKHPQFYRLKAEVLKKLDNQDYKKYEEIAKKIDDENMKKIKKMAKGFEMDINIDEDFLKRK